VKNTRKTLLLASKSRLQKNENLQRGYKGKIVYKDGGEALERVARRGSGGLTPTNTLHDFQRKKHRILDE